MTPKERICIAIHCMIYFDAKEHYSIFSRLLKVWDERYYNK